MEERQEHRGFVITVSTQDHRAGGSTVTLLIERPLKDGDVRKAPPISKPERYQSPHSGPAAVGEAMDRAKRAIDDALGPRNPFGDWAAGSGSACTATADFPVERSLVSQKVASHHSIFGFSAMDQHKLTKSEKLKLAWEKRRATFVPPMKGKKMSDESGVKISAAAKARPSNRLGIKHTDETRALISKRTREGVPRGPRSKRDVEDKTQEWTSQRFIYARIPGTWRVILNSILLFSLMIQP
jgi:hypothetical protein